MTSNFIKAQRLTEILYYIYRGGGDATLLISGCPVNKENIQD